MKLSRESKYTKHETDRDILFRKVFTFHNSLDVNFKGKIGDILLFDEKRKYKQMMKKMEAFLDEMKTRKTVQKEVVEDECP